MKSLELRLVVTADGQVLLPSFPELEPGEYNAVLVIEAAPDRTDRPPLNLPVVDLGPWPEDLSLSRSFYGEA